MKQVVMVGPRKSEVIDVPIPEITDDQLLVKVTYTGMCHSEWYPWTVAQPGELFGHESVGVVARCGRNVTGFKEGDRVTGLGGGGLREFIVMEPEKVVHVPDNLKDEDAIVEPLACLLSAAVKMPLTTLGDSVAVVGCGYMGLGMISLFKAMGYGDIVAVDIRKEALDNARRFGATETYLPEELPQEYILDWKAIGAPDLKRDGHKTDIFGIGFPNVMEFTGTESGLQLAGEMVCAHGRMGIGGYHNDSLRTIDYKLWNFKAMDTINCHERRIMYEAGLCGRIMMLLSRGIWNFTGVTNHIYSLEEFDKGMEEMEKHANGFIKGAVRCD
ncbi:alcohol dehydrogenase catalytic domain-containing protein [Victivallis vadensis]|jgi:alcohol dehydrogenase groES domain protein|uniref:alcohol dehydrogenase catalytic domain-containing protein n=1 Tax=Victivallis vadensis TaxID=172901 RepID=UPI0023F71BE4|nr:alcohol dehydrogenase catalytic domain-containing protein [Victivallis vadensis]